MTTLTLLGTKGGPAIRPGTPLPTSSLLQMNGQNILIDAGLGAAMGVCRVGVALERLDAIVITHLHSDHYLELGPLLHTAWTAGLKSKIPVWGPDGTAQYWDHFCASMQFDIDLRIRDEGRPDLRDMITFNRIESLETIGAVAVQTLRNAHPPITDTFALRFDGDHCVVMSGDTAPIPQMVDFAHGADLLVHEAMLTAGVDALCARVGNGDDRLRTHLMQSHSPAAEVAKIAQAAGARILALNHLVPSDDPDFTEADWQAECTPHFDGKLYVGRDGMGISL